MIHARPSTPPDRVSRMMPAVRKLANRFARMPGAMLQEDLVGAGLLGLSQALTRDDLSGGAFDAYAFVRVKGAMLDELRRHDPLSRKSRNMAARVQRGVRELSARLGRAPEHTEVAAEVGLPLDAYWRALGETWRGRSQPLRIDEGVSDGQEHTAILGDPDAEPADELLDRARTSEKLREALEHLPARERTVLLLGIDDGLTLDEIGRQLGVTESRACQLRTQAIHRVRAFLGVEPTRAAPVRARRDRRGRSPRIAVAA